MMFLLIHITQCCRIWDLSSSSSTMMRKDGGGGVSDCDLTTIWPAGGRRG